MDPLTAEEIAGVRHALGYDDLSARECIDDAVPRLLDEVERARALLRRIEWVSHGLPVAEYGGYCPSCGEWSGLDEIRGLPAEPGPGHKPGCELAALIG